MSPRPLQKPTNPAGTALLVNLLARYASDRPDKTHLDQRVARSMESISQARTIASRIVQNFSGIPARRRQAAFGDLLRDLHQSPLELARLANAARLFRGVAPSRIARDDVPRPVEPPDSPEDEFTLKYRGLYCNEESTWDRGSWQDEPYVLTSVVHIAANGENVVRSERHPFSETSYNDVDSGDSREGPVAACWKGRATEISLISVLMEHDEGDPNAYKDELTVIVNAAADIAEQQGWYDAPDSLKELLVDGLNWLLGPGDDVVDTVFRTISPSQLRAFARSSMRLLEGTRRYPRPGYAGFPDYVELRDQTKVPAHFQIDYYGDGAHYVVGFEVERHPAPRPPILEDVRRNAEAIARAGNNNYVPNP